MTLIDEFIVRNELDGAHPFYRMPSDITQRIAREYLALRAVVEALAASWPLETYRGMWVTDCPLCDGEPVGFPYPQTIEHSPDCPYARAVALVGPAGERAEGE